MPRLRPRVWKKDENKSDRLPRQSTQKRADIIRMDSDISNAPFLDRRQSLDDAILERLAANKTDVGVAFGLIDQMLGSTEAHLEPDLPDGRFEHRLQGSVRQSFEIDPAVR